MQFLLWPPGGDKQLSAGLQVFPGCVARPRPLTCPVKVDSISRNRRLSEAYLAARVESCVLNFWGKILILKKI